MKAYSKFTIRRATLDDLDLLVIQRHKMLQEIQPRKTNELKKTDSMYRKWLRYMFRKRRIVCFLAINQLQKAVGGGCVWIRDAPPSPWTGSRLRVPYLMSMYTEPNCRGLGIASAIVKCAMAWCKKMKYNRMTLHASEAGRTVYRKLGWTRTWEMRVELSPAKLPRRS
jgi:GNAT superfamily N-acetyltransferase